MSEEAIEVLRQLLGNSRLAITVVDPSGRLTLFNQAAERLTGYRREEVLGRPVTMFYASEQEALRLGERVAALGKVEDHETVLVGKDGRQIPISIIITPLQDVLGRPMGTLGITVDLTERKRLERDVLEAKRRADFYNDLLCHDIRNFDQTMLGYLELLLEEAVGELNPRQRSILQVCRRQAKRMSDLIDRVRMLSRIEAEGPPPSQSVELAPVIREAVQAVLETYPDRKVRMDCRSSEEAWVMAGPLLFEAAFNLINNAVAHNNAQEPEVRVTVLPGRSADARTWRVVVEDNGPGLPEDRKEVVFERFARSEVSGSGVGLSVVKAFVDRCGGRVWAEDRVTGRPDEGAKVVLELAAAGPESDSGGSGAPGG